MTEEEIAVRRPVWIAMSDLFLDTDVRLWYSKVALILAESPFTSEQLEAIFMGEVAPVAEVNLLSPAGEGTGFDVTWLVARVTARLGQKLRLPSFIARSRWQSILPLVEGLRKTDPVLRPRRVAAWEQLSKLFLDRNCELTGPLPDGWTINDLEGIWRNDMWPTYGRSVDGYRKQNPDAYPSEHEIEAGWRKFKSSLG